MFDEYRRVRKLKRQADLILYDYILPDTRIPKRGVIVKREKRLYVVLGTSICSVHGFAIEVTIYFREIFDISKKKKINKSKNYTKWN